MLIFFSFSFISSHLVGIDLDNHSMKTVYEKFGLEPGTQDFIGHAMALYLDDESVACSRIRFLEQTLTLVLALAVTSLKSHDLHMNALFYTLNPWRDMANLRTSILFTV